MESEERPAKMRKLGHPDSDDYVAVPGAALPDGGISILNGNAADVQPSTAIEKEENAETPNPPAEGEEAAPKLSKNQLKKQARLERWEAGREDRKLKRKEKIKAKKERKRENWKELRANGETPPYKPPRHGDPAGTQVPITIIFDCDFEDLMFDNEMKSLGLQITRCYSDNRKAPFRCHLAVSSFGGKMKERFDGILAKQYTSWKGFRFLEEDFVRVAEQSKEWMKGAKGGVVAGALEQVKEANGTEKNEDAQSEEEGEVVYLSAESENVLDRLKPNSTYIIGGLVDKNRHKGLCYKRAMNRGIKTAKLPIGEFLQMKSRQVLVTNHVLEIMLKWLEFGDWGKAFMEVIPKRKGGVLKTEAEEGDGESHQASDGEENDAAIAEHPENQGDGATSAEMGASRMAGEGSAHAEAT